jgi:hypothetical protein
LRVFVAVEELFAQNPGGESLGVFGFHASNLTGFATAGFELFG